MTAAAASPPSDDGGLRHECDHRDVATNRLNHPWPAARVAAGGELKGTGYELFVVLVSLLSAVNSAIAASILLTSGGGPAQEVVVLIDATLTPVFLLDVLVRWHPPARAYLVAEGGWADLVAVVPMLRVFKLLRVARIVRLLRARGRAALLADIDSSRAVSIFLLTAFLVVAVVEFASSTIYYVEKGAPGANISSAGDAIWWALVTITTVGYGDYYPVTAAGRLIGAFLLFAGIALFSVLTGFIANVFLAPRNRPRPVPEDEARAAIASARELLAEQEERTGAIRDRLDALERAFQRGPQNAQNAQNAQHDGEDPSPFLDEADEVAGGHDP